MGKRTRKTEPATEPDKPRVASGAAIALPTPRVREAVSVGVTKVRRPPAGSGKPRMRARQAGTRSDQFPRGGDAFERWCLSQGISPREKRTEAEWQALLDQFAARTIHGHRRGRHGGSHRADRP